MLGETTLHFVESDNGVFSEYSPATKCHFNHVLLLKKQQSVGMGRTEPKSAHISVYNWLALGEYVSAESVGT